MKKSMIRIIGIILSLVLIFIPNTIAMADNVEASWTTLASMSIKRRNFQTEVINGKIYAIGGIASDIISSTEVYNPTTNIWTTLAPMSIERAAFQTEVINGKIYAIGGTANEFNVQSSTEVYDPTTNIWTKLASMSTKRKEFQTEVINGKIYAIGGLYNDNGEKFSSSTEVYDPTTNTWIKLASMSEARCEFQTEVIDGKIYAIGGLNKNGTQSSTEVYDLTTNTWTKLASMSDTMDQFETEVINGKIYAIYKTTLEVYDPTSNTWTKLASPTKYHSCAQTEVIDGKIYAIGGNDSSVEVYTTPGSTTNPGDSTNSGDTSDPGDSTGSSSDSSDSTGTGDSSTPNTQSKLIAVGGDSKVDLTWPNVNDATSYTVKRSTSMGGPYTSIATDLTGNTYTDSTVTNGTTYYYEVTVMKNGSESWNSNEASATPTAPTDSTQTEKRALLVITMQNGERKEYDLTMEKINDFMTWYNNPPASSPTYVIEKNYNRASFTSRKDYISHKQISSVEVDEYNN